VIRAAAVAAVAALALAPASARADTGALDQQIQAALAEPGDPVQAGIWFGPAGGEPIYQLAQTRAMPAASVVKTAILVELFAEHAGHLDEPLGPAADVALADDKHPAMAPFSAAQRKEIRAQLLGATVRTIGAIMMGSRKASNAVYNAAASASIAALGGPADATARIRARDPAFGGVVIGRYMLAPRTPSDNTATPAALAAVLAAVATARPPGVDAATAEAMAQAMLPGKDALGAHRHKDGNLDNDPMVVVKTGFYPRAGAPPLIYVVAAALSARPTIARADAARRLDKLADALLARLRAAAR
jgi:hypothetical protein